MFVTLFLGILDTGPEKWSTATQGTTLPCYFPCRKSSHTSAHGGIALGVAEEAFTNPVKSSCRRGIASSCIRMVDRGHEQERRLFSESRLIKELAEMKGKSLQEIVTGVMGKVGSFSAGVPQADDITLMVIRYHGKK